VSVDGLKARVINEIIKREGGYVNDSDDSGGETNFGVTEKVARKYGYKGTMKGMSREFAFSVYVVLYWDKLKLDAIAEVSGLVAEELADTAVNMGVGRAGKFLQRSLNVLNNRGALYGDIGVDGQVGSGTLSAFNALMDKRGIEGAEILYKMLNCLQGAFYVELSERREKDEKYIYGWFKNRV